MREVFTAPVAEARRALKEEATGTNDAVVKNVPLTRTPTRARDTTPLAWPCALLSRSGEGF